MKKYQLLLLALLLVSNNPLITQKPDNITPGSIKNIKKSTDESPTTDKPNPLARLSPASTKNVAKSKNKKFSPAILYITKNLLYIASNYLFGYLKGSYRAYSSLGILEMSIDQSNHFLFKSYLEIEDHDAIILSIFDGVSIIHNTCHGLFVSKKHLIQDVRELACFAGFLHGIKEPLKSFYGKLISIYRT